MSEKSLFDQFGGYDTLRSIAKTFYDKVYKHPWIGQYFANIRQQHIEDQQTDFMAQAMGGPRKYFGTFPIQAHQHIYITQELFDLRESLLMETMKELHIPQELVDQWFKIDRAFKQGIIKESLADCKVRIVSEGILDFPNPEQFKKVG